VDGALCPNYIEDMSNAPTILQLFERQAKQIKAAKASKSAPSVAKPVATGKLPQYAGLLASIVANRLGATKPRPVKTAKPAASPKPAKPVSFEHLLAATPAEFYDDDAPPVGNARAAAIVAAAAMARSAIPVMKPAKGTAAAAILNAGRRSRTPTGDRAPEPTGLAAKIVAAGKRRRSL
jgi:hypothetical protein